MEVWFGEKMIFPDFNWVIFRFQPLIYRGVIAERHTKPTVRETVAVGHPPMGGAQAVEGHIGTLSNKGHS